MSIQQASFNLQICLHYVILNDRCLDCKVNVLSPNLYLILVYSSLNLIFVFQNVTTFDNLIIKKIN